MGGWGVFPEQWKAGGSVCGARRGERVMRDGQCMNDVNVNVNVCMYECK